LKLFRSLFFGILICLSAISCEKDQVDPDRVEITGVVQRQGITVYQYGTHTICGYALRSSSVTLDDYVNQTVTVVGHKIDGYPIDFGPDYIEVEEIR
jgi:hypothetical protein